MNIIIDIVSGFSSSKTKFEPNFIVFCREQLSRVQTISDLLEQLVASLLASSILLQDDNNLF